MWRIPHTHCAASCVHGATNPETTGRPPTGKHHRRGVHLRTATPPAHPKHGHTHIGCKGAAAVARAVANPFTGTSGQRGTYGRSRHVAPAGGVTACGLNRHPAPPAGRVTACGQHRHAAPAAMAPCHSHLAGAAAHTKIRLIPAPPRPKPRPGPGRDSPLVGGAHFVYFIFFKSCLSFLSEMWQHLAIVPLDGFVRP